MEYVKYNTNTHSSILTSPQNGISTFRTQVLMHELYIYIYIYLASSLFRSLESRALYLSYGFSSKLGVDITLTKIARKPYDHSNVKTYR